MQFCVCCLPSQCNQLLSMTVGPERMEIISLLLQPKLATWLGTVCWTMRHQHFTTCTASCAALLGSISHRLRPNECLMKEFKHPLCMDVYLLLMHCKL